MLSTIGRDELNGEKRFWLGVVRPIIAAGIRIIATWSPVDQSLDISGVDPFIPLEFGITAVPFLAAGRPH